MFIEKPQELLALFGETGDLSAKERRTLYAVSNMGRAQFKGLMEYWKDNHAEAAVRTAAQEAFETLDGQED